MQAIVDSMKIEKGKYPYHVESLLNQVISMGSRGSIAKVMELYKGKMSLQVKI